MVHDENIINYYYPIFNEIEYLLKYNIKISSTKLINNHIDYNMINIIKKSILETLEAPFYYKLFQIKTYNNLLEIKNVSNLFDKMKINVCLQKSFFILFSFGF